MIDPAQMQPGMAGGQSAAADPMAIMAALQKGGKKKHAKKRGKRK